MEPHLAQRSLLQHPATAWVVLMLSLVFTALAWSISADAIRAGAMQRFRFQTEDIAAAITRRLLTYETALRAGAGLFNASDTVTRGEWHKFVSDLQLQQTFPGIQGLGFSLMVTPQGLARHLDDIRAEGFPDYRIRPAGERDTYSSIIYLEPFDWRNQRAFGYDMYAEPVRRQAMKRARDSGAPAISGRVTLVQETTEDVQYGFLMYLPVYRKDLPTATGDERRAALLGFVYSPFRAKDFMQGILTVDQGRIDFELYDGASPSAATLLFDNQAGGTLDALRPAPPGAFTALVPVPAGQRTWSLHIHTLPGYLSGTQQAQPLIVAAGGIVIDLFLFYIVTSIGRRQRLAEGRSVQLAEQLTESERRYSALFASAREAMLVSEPETGAILEANPAAQRFYGYDQAQLQRLRISDIDQLPPEEVQVDRRRTQEEHRDHGCFPHRLATGEVRQVEVYSGPFQYRGRPAIYSIVHDVTDRQRAAAAIQASLDFQTELLEAIPAPVFYKDTEGRYLNVNGPFSALLGSTKAELIGQTVYDSWPRENADIFFTRDQALFQNPGIQVYESQITNRCGERRDVVFHKATLHAPDGTLRGLVGFILDITERKVAEAALQRSETRFRTLFTASKVVMLLIDPATGAIVDANAAAADYYGFTVAELRRMEIGAINTLSPEEIAAEMQRAAVDQRWHFHFRHRLASGAVRDVEVHSGPLELDGRPLLYSIVHDITDQKTAEAALRASEERHRSALVALAEGVAVYDRHGTLIAANPAAERILGLSSDELRARSVDAEDWRIVRGDGSPFPSHEWPSVVTLSTGIPQRDALMGVFKPNGQLTWLQVNAEPIRDPLTGTSQAAVVSFNDITARKAAKDALRASEERLQLVLDGSSDGFWDWNVKTGAILFSRHWAEMLGYDLAEVQPHIRIWRRLMHPDDQAHSRAALQAHLAGHTAHYQAEHRLLTKHGEWRWFLHRGKVTARDDRGRPLRMAGTHTDITERRRMEEALRVSLIATERHDAWMVALNRMNERLLSCETRPEAYAIVARAAGRLFAGASGALAVCGEDTASDLRVVATWGDPGALPATFPLDHCWALQRGEVHEVMEPARSVLCRHLTDPRPPPHLCVPLLVRGETLGLLHVSSPAELTAAPFGDLRTLAVTVSESVKLVLSNLRLQETLREQSIRDPLTGLFNRRYLDEALPRELQLSRRRDEPLAVALLDLDHFKRFNDAYGHEAGEAVLRAVGALLVGSVRDGDLVCRYGGEELTLILPGAGLDAARARLDGLRQTIMQTRVLYQGGDLPTLTVSIGVTVAGAQETDAAALLARADAALYRAKEAGRNRVVAVEPAVG
jgi:diguanylate cyclase (GGDEF)-like protein/PAS domain S-box-containing protein